MYQSFRQLLHRLVSTVFVHLWIEFRLSINIKAYLYIHIMHPLHRSVYFSECADFIHDSRMNNGAVYVHW